MNRARKAIAVVVAVLILAPLAMVAGMRGLRGSADGPHAVGPPSVGLLRVRNLFTEVYGLRVGRDVILFDGGVDKDGQALDKLLDGLKASRDEVTHVFLSHGHFDHVQHSPLCTKAKIHVGRADVDLLAGRVTAGRQAALWFGRVLPPPPIEANAPIDGSQSAWWLDGGKPLHALAMPGHTAGSFVYYYEGVLIAGDSINIDGDHLAFAMPAFSDDLAANRKSISALRSFIETNPVDTVCTGHQGCTPSGKGAAMIADLVARAERNE